MNVSLQLIFQNYGGALSDAEHVAFETEVALMAEPLGFDKIFVVEHHFTDYAACPDNAQFLSWLAAKTSTLKLGTGAFILPWNTPIRVAEKIALLDHLSGGRAVLGVGRGLARREYDGFGISMQESRDRFDEAARMILDATDRGWIEGEGPYYPQARTEIRPRPLRGFRDRLYAIGMSPESVEQAARLGARLAIFSQMPWEMWAGTSLARYRTVYGETHGGTPPPPLTCDLMYCAPTDAEAEAVARVHMPEYYLSVLDHYELLSDNFKGVRGYEMYEQASAILSSIGKDDQAQGYLHVQSWGSPATIVEKLRTRRELVGEFELSVIARYGAIPREKALASLELFGREVLPELRRW
jgi:alkanesulfonate monooxygenase SsuD/methylene tetrahydromethanopterin reductase-like flavin-dependent oxidoreductase (luciferase family)